MAASSKAEEINGLQKAAILMIALGPEKSAAIFKHLKEDEVEELTLEIGEHKEHHAAGQGERGKRVLSGVSGAAVYRGGRYQLREGTAGEVLRRREGDGRDRQADGVPAGKAFRVCEKGGRGTALKLYPGRTSADHRAHFCPIWRPVRRRLSFRRFRRTDRRTLRNVLL